MLQLHMKEIFGFMKGGGRGYEALRHIWLYARVGRVTKFFLMILDKQIEIKFRVTILKICV